ncbi:hypothetical protein SAMN04488144_1537 [Methylobacterium sp. 190mf]|jgi:hypothetical protein|uniref:hypothetical protein n=1 Tax=Methylobacterium sp. 190mf TaxID=1761798 RepID=UPI00089F211B|nr:hypothetical protein [Methylobacterium sp. 190mf]SEG71612.1 hypothetical protein SAMN04488144_1537 [Methylobacterium sp. 190mf]
MSAPSPRRDNLATVIFDMEDSVRNLVRWGQAVRTMGCPTGEIEAGSLYVVGDAVVEAAMKVEEDLERCFELSRALKGGAL